MKKLSILTKRARGLTAAAIMLGASLCLGLTASVSATSVDDSAAAADINAKTAIGEANAEANAAADPIKPCGPSPKDKDSSAWGKYFKVNNVNIRRSPSIDSRICAQGQKSHKVDYHCYTVGKDGRTWTYLRNVTTRYAGWVRDDLLKGHGSFVRC
jgi:hypothetical protein